MRSLSYYQKRRLRRAGIITVVVVLALLAAAIITLAYLHRFVVYTEDGAHLALAILEEDPAAEAISGDYIVGDSVEHPHGSNALPNAVTAATWDGGLLHGAYADTAALLEADTAAAAYAALSDCNALMLDMKGASGNYFYHSSMAEAETPAAMDVDKVEALVTEANRNGAYLIARIPAFTDSAYALNHREQALPLDSGALWMDSRNYYWLDPGSDAVLQRLEAICRELADMGFDEVVLSDFGFPESDNIFYESDRSRLEIAQAAADTLLASLSDLPLTVSFDYGNVRMVSVPAESHIVVSLEGISIDDALTLGDTGQLVFLADSVPEGYHILSPLVPAAQED